MKAAFFVRARARVYIHSFKHRKKRRNTLRLFTNNNGSLSHELCLHLLVPQVTSLVACLACEQALLRGRGRGGGRGRRACTHPIVLRVPPRAMSNLIQSARAGNQSVSLPDLK